MRRHGSSIAFFAVLYVQVFYAVFLASSTHIIRYDMTKYSLAKAADISFRRGMIQIKPFMIARTLMCSAAFFGASYAAFAQTAEITAASETRGEIYCFPTKGVPKLIERINAIDDKRRNIVDVDIDPKFVIKDGGVWPDAFYLAKDGEILIDLPMSRETGRVPKFLEAIIAEPTSDICVLDPTRAHKPVDDEGLYFEIGLSPYFHNPTGEHNIDDIIEGSRDAKSFYKKMIPPAFRMFMPDTTYLAVKYQDKALQTPGTAKIFARVDGQDVALESEAFKDFVVVSGKALRKMGASALIVQGGAYDLMPIPSLDIMRKFAWSGDDQAKPEDTDLSLEEIDKTPAGITAIGDTNDAEITPEN